MLGGEIIARRRFATDNRFRDDGVWKIHLTIGRSSYAQKVAAVTAWLEENLGPKEEGSWKYLDGGEKYKEDFTIYLGSYGKMMDFAQFLEADAVREQLAPSYRGRKGGTDRIVGTSGKLSARFEWAPHGGAKGRNGMTFLYTEGVRSGLPRLAPPPGPAREKAWADSSALHRTRYHGYFWPEDEAF